MWFVSAMALIKTIKINQYESVIGYSVTVNGRLMKKFLDSVVRTLAAVYSTSWRTKKCTNHANWRRDCDKTIRHALLNMTKVSVCQCMFDCKHGPTFNIHWRMLNAERQTLQMYICLIVLCTECNRLCSTTTTTTNPVVNWNKRWPTLSLLFAYKFYRFHFFSSTHWI